MLSGVADHLFRCSKGFTNTVANPSSATTLRFIMETNSTGRLEKGPGKL